MRLLYRAAAAAVVYAAVVVMIAASLLMGGCGKKPPAVAPPPQPESITAHERALRQQEACGFRNVQVRIHEDAERACRSIANYPTSVERMECFAREEFAWGQIQPKVAAAEAICEAGRVSD